MSLRNHTSDKIIRILIKYYGFELKGRRGSHVVLRHPTNSRRATVPYHKGETLKLGTLRSILIQAGIAESDFIRYL